MKRKVFMVLIAAILLTAGVVVAEHAEHVHKHGAGHEDGVTSVLKGIVDNLLADNADFVKRHKSDYFKPFADAQHPRATLVACSDSRVHMHAFDKTPDGDVFVVRNIGNQLPTSEGSVEYGVHHLHTPLLIVVGHSACGAIKAASGDYSAESASIKKELDTIKIEKGGDWTANVKANVNNQVTASVAKFAEEVKEGKLTVVGAVYDFRNDLKQGQGKLVVININGETDADKIKANPILAKVEKIKTPAKHKKAD